MYTLVSPSYRCFISNLALIGQSVSEKKSFEYYGNIRVHVYCTRVEDQSLGSNFFQNQSSVHSTISFNFFPSNDIFDNFSHLNARATYVDIAAK